MFKELRFAPIFESLFPSAMIKSASGLLPYVKEESVKQCNLQHWHFVQKEDFNHQTLCRLYLTFESMTSCIFTIFHGETLLNPVIITKKTKWRNLAWFRMGRFYWVLWIHHFYNGKAQSREPTKIYPFGLPQRCFLVISSGFYQKLFLNSLYVISSKLPFSQTLPHEAILQRKVSYRNLFKSDKIISRFWQFKWLELLSREPTMNNMI